MKEKIVPNFSFATTLKNGVSNMARKTKEPLPKTTGSAVTPRWNTKK
jgi:hypothetical protein